MAGCQSATTTPHLVSTTQVASATPNPKITQVQTERSTPTPGITLVPTDTPDEIDQNCCADYRIGLLGAPTTLNYWRYLAEDQSIWTGFVIADQAPSLYEFPALQSKERLDFVPALAADLPSEHEQRDDLWVITVPLIKSAAWSDGEPITAKDIVFTIQTVFDLQLGGQWQDFYAAENLARVEAVDDHTVEFYFNEEPGLAQWQFAAAMGPILPQHYWNEYVEQARSYVEGVSIPETCTGDLSLAQISACQAFASARQALYEIEPLSAPSGGGYSATGPVSKTIQRVANPNFYASNLKISLYEDGTWERTFPDGRLQRFYGQGQGEPLVSYHRGPHSPSIIFTVYDNLILAYNALSNDREDAIINPNSLTEEWLRQTAESDVILQHVSQQNGLAYLAFNLRRQPLDQLEFRQAVEILIDPEVMASDDLEGVFYPAYSIIPAANSFWQNPVLGPNEDPLTPRERLDFAMQILQDAGWSWRTAPTWDAASKQIIPGDELRTPNGDPMPETGFIFPKPEEDPLMAAFGQQIADLLIALGVPLLPEPLSRDAIVNRVLIAGGTFDLYLLDWRFPLYPDYLCALFRSEDDTILTGGLNTTGYDNPAFDSLCDRFLAETDAQAAQELAYQLQVLLADDRPYIPLFHPQVVDMWRDHVILPFLPGLDGISGAGGMQTDARVLNK
ncbi:MAG: ABC transporter substrate-binding protein [Anaerolineales bacterium]